MNRSARSLAVSAAALSLGVPLAAQYWEASTAAKTPAMVASENAVPAVGPAVELPAPKKTFPAEPTISMRGLPQNGDTIDHIVDSRFDSISLQVDRKRGRVYAEYTNCDDSGHNPNPGGHYEPGKPDYPGRGCAFLAFDLPELDVAGKTVKFGDKLVATETEHHVLFIKYHRWDLEKGWKFTTMEWKGREHFGFDDKRFTEVELYLSFQ